MSADLLGIPRDFEFKGKRYKIAFRDIQTESVFAAWCASEAALDLWRLKNKVPPDFYAEQMKLYNAKVCGKQFVWGSEDVHSISWSDIGQRQLLWLKLKRGEEKGGDFIARETIDEIAADPAKWDELLLIMWEQDYPDFFARVKQEREAMRKASPPASSTDSPSSPPLLASTSWT